MDIIEIKSILISGHVECWEGLQEYSYKVKQPTGTEKNEIKCILIVLLYFRSIFLTNISVQICKLGLICDQSMRIEKSIVRFSSYKPVKLMQVCSSLPTLRTGSVFT